MKTSNVKAVLLGGLFGTLALSACGVSKPKNGKDGVDGLTGDAGAQGRPSLISVADEPAGDHCATGGQRVDTGLDTNGSGVLDASEVTASTYVCAGSPGANGADGSVGLTGGDGGSGSPGRSSLLRTSREPDGANCAHGGVRIEAGLDTNGDGTLQDGEVDAAQTQFFCQPAGVGACSASGTLPFTGDYTAGDGAEHWLRRTATATTYTVVPAGAAAPTAPPQLFRVKLVCGPWLLLEAPSGEFARLDAATVSGSLRVCLRPTLNAASAAALSPPDSAATTGCAEGPWTTLTRQP